MPEEDFRRAAAPLFASEVVDVVEWSFDLGFDRALPAWVHALLDFYAASGRLLGHGVHFSGLSVGDDGRRPGMLVARRCPDR